MPRVIVGRREKQNREEIIVSPLRKQRPFPRTGDNHPFVIECKQVELIVGLIDIVAAVQISDLSVFQLNRNNELQSAAQIQVAREAGVQEDTEDAEAAGEGVLPDPGRRVRGPVAEQETRQVPAARRGGQCDDLRALLFGFLTRTCTVLRASSVHKTRTRRLIPCTWISFTR